MFDDKCDRMYELQEKMRGRRYEGHRAAVTAVIADAERVLRDAGKLGKWERSELDQAMHAVQINFLTLALNCVGKAVEVSQLPTDDYESGFNYGKKD